MSIKLTDEAVTQIVKSAQDGGMQNIPLRIAVKRRDDGSLEYAMGFDEQADADITREYDDLMVVVNPMSIDLLTGAILDYAKLDDGSREFIFLNPNDPNYIAPQNE